MAQPEKQPVAVGDRVRFTLNGKEVCVQADPMARLLDVLREDLGLTGSKEGCGEGECGACSVLLDGQVVCSCLVPIFQVEGSKVRSVEGLPADGPLQQGLASGRGVQCGACTPGLVMAVQALLERHNRPGRALIREALAGNLCRCTGYQGIFEAVEQLVQPAGGEA